MAARLQPVGKTLVVTTEVLSRVSHSMADQTWGQGAGSPSVYSQPVGIVGGPVDGPSVWSGGGFYGTNPFA